MSEAFLIAIVTALVNGSITWGIISTKLAWLRRDVDSLQEHVDACDAKHYGPTRHKMPSKRYKDDRDDSE